MPFVTREREGERERDEGVSVPITVDLIVLGTYYSLLHRTTGLRTSFQVTVRSPR